MANALDEIHIKAKSFQDADFLSAVFGKYRQEAVTGLAPIVLFGAGSAGENLYPIFKLHGVNPICFCDNSQEKIGKLVCDIPVISAVELLREYSKALVVITIGARSDEVKQQLVEKGFAEQRILIVSNLEALQYYTHLDQWYWTEEELLAHQDELNCVYNLLSDQKSRDIFTSRIALFTGGADYQSFIDFLSNFSDVRHKDGSDFKEAASSTNYYDETYLQFNNDIITLKNDEILIDGGAYTGDSSIEFIKACKRNNLAYRKIICYEPDPGTFDKLRENTSPYPDISLRPFGLWSHATTLRFVDSSLLRPGSTRIESVYGKNGVLSDDTSGLIEIPTTSLDEDISGLPATIIKMDVEGSEINALRGAAKTIKGHRPKLIISAYHKRNDLFEIPLLIHNLEPKYKIYFRHFSRNFGETTLFAI